jgi:hypothetical protein
MGRDQLQRLLGRIRRALRIERRFTLEESYQLLELSEAVVDHARLQQSYYQRPMDHAMVDIEEWPSAYERRRRPSKTRSGYCGLTGRGEPYDRHGRWNLRLGDTLRSAGDETREKAG